MKTTIPCAECQLAVKGGKCGALCEEYERWRSEEIVEKRYGDWVPIRNISAWLAAYTDPPEYALKIVGWGGKEVTPELKYEAWKYHIEKLKDYGLMEG